MADQVPEGPEEQPVQEQQLQEAQEMSQYEVKLKEDVQEEDLDAEGSSILEESDDVKDKDEEVKEDGEMKEQSQQVHQESQVPQDQNPQVKKESSGQVADASAAASSSSAVQPQQQYHQYYQATAAGGQEARLFWGCAIHGTPGLRCMVCDIEYWRHYLFFVSGYRYHGRVPPPPIPIFPMSLHRPSPSSNNIPSQPLWYTANLCNRLPGHASQLSRGVWLWTTRRRRWRWRWW
ncbi:hypothetical protein GGI35DRAFT_29806 [Trichoderma velutinum]